MFSNLTIALLVGLSFAGWVYAKIQRQTGGNIRSSLTVAGISGAALALVTYFILDMIF